MTHRGHKKESGSFSIFRCVYMANDRKSSPRVLTKSLFKTSCECLAKLNYVKDPSYGSMNDDNPFLKALAEGGFQVGELAKLYYPDGQMIDTLDKAEALKRTRELLTREDVTIFEAAIAFGNLLVRVDILNKRGKLLELIEVKSKSVDPSEAHLFVNKVQIKKGVTQLRSEWEPYLLDIAFQSHVLARAYPGFEIRNYLLMADKSKLATVDGLNQRFLLREEEGGKRSFAVVAPGTTRQSLGEDILTRLSVDSEVKHINEDYRFDDGRDFSERVSAIEEAWTQGKRFVPVLSKDCGSCEFRIPESMKDQGLKSGFEECWTQEGRLSPQDFKRPFVFDLWNFRKAVETVLNGRYFIDQLEQEDLAPKSVSKAASKTSRNSRSERSPSGSDEARGLTQADRQWKQVEKVKEADPTPYLDLDGLRAELATWKFPLHFIDFETSRVAIPFHKGRRPYEQIAFQFSHHLMTADGKIAHRTQWIHQERGTFPNFEFVRNLKAALSSDSGTILRFATHENSVLNDIHEQLGQMSSREIPDRDELREWIRTVTQSSKNAENPWTGERNMVDLCALVKNYFYHPRTEGSNSIKDVLPAVLAESEFLRARYSIPVYGADDGIPSHNFKDHRWIHLDSRGEVINPYKLLGPVFEIDASVLGGAAGDRASAIFRAEKLADGGAAMTAWARMQFTEMSPEERERVTRALLRYCELDTFSMVLIYEYWKNAIEQSTDQKTAA